MDRRDKILAGLDVTRLTGIEIGALDKPLVHPGAGGSVLYVDHADTPTLRQKYAGDPGVDLGALVEVDAVWGENTLREVLEARAAAHPDTAARVDYVIASHVIEHVPDLVGWLGEIREVLKPTGQLRLAIPDRRFTFDCLREDARVADVLAAHLVGARRPTPHAILDSQLNAAPAVTSVRLWDGSEDSAALAPSFEWQHTVAAVREALAGAYHDVHCWAITPYSLADIFVFLAKHGLLRLACHSFEDTLHGDCEFYLGLVPSDDLDFVAETWRRVRREARQETPGSRFRPVDVLTGVAGPTESSELAEQRRLARERLELAQAMEARACTAESLAEERLFLVGSMEARAIRAEAALEAMRRSMSWRLTQPLRSALRTFRGRSRVEASKG
jgi:Methyltransferase domain